MSTETEQKHMEKPEVQWKRIIDQAKISLQENAAVKAGIIRHCCELLEGAGMPLGLIMGRLVKELAEFASRSYIYDVIDKKYSKAEEIPEPRKYTKKKNTEKSNPMSGQIDDKKSTEEKTKEMVQTITGDNGDPKTEIEGPTQIIAPANVEDYKIEDLENYSKKFLISVVIYLHNKIQALKSVPKRNR